MSGYDLKSNASLKLMASRLYPVKDAKDYFEGRETFPQGLDGLDDQRIKIYSGGGSLQQERMIFDKRRSLDRALKYSYQAATIKKLQCDDGIDNAFRPNIVKTEEHEYCRCLINPDKTKQNYDDKIISVHYEENFHSGDVFEWMGTNTYWIIYLQDLTETAYFRGEIRRCSYEIAWEDENGEHSTYAAVRGPVETKIDYIQKHQISVDNPNYSLNILLPKTDDTLNYFKRYSKFFLNDQKEKICWRVEATDSISTPGILEITAVEYYVNEYEDDLENMVVGGLKVEPINPNPEETEEKIEGETFIKPHQVYEYYFKDDILSDWTIEPTNCPVRLKIDPNNPLRIKLIWECLYSGQFKLNYGDFSKIIVVESLY